MNTQKRLLSGLDGNHRFILALVMVALSSSLAAFAIGGWLTGCFVAAVLILLLLLTRPVWVPESTSAPSLKIAMTSLAVVTTVVGEVIGNTPEGKPFRDSLLDLLHIHRESVAVAVQPDKLLSAMIMAFVLGALFLINWLFRDNTVLQSHPTPLDVDFPEQTYSERLKRYRDILKDRLSAIDNETKWDDYFFEPLSAEVEVVSGRRSHRTIVDLIRALRRDHLSRIILVVGDPGSGKSTALRKLAKDLLAEVDRTGRLPVYLNLKEWEVERAWSEQNPPKLEDLRKFILHQLKGDNAFADDFLLKYFDRMFDRGRFFFILDSFDEIPNVLDVSEASWLIKHLSRLFTEFFLSQDQGRGIVASRFYRRPQFPLKDSATFEIRPFSDLQIHDALLRSEKLGKNTIDTLFSARPELIPIARNPFSAALIRTYAETHGGLLPPNQLEMYESYIDGRLALSEIELKIHNLSRDQILEHATFIAWTMLSAAEIGLEAPVSTLEALLPDIPIAVTTDLLRYSGLARLSASAKPRFSFVHRRLNEYFVARKIFNQPALANLTAIPTDSRFRDALVLYCEVGEELSIKEIADFCWREITSAEEVGTDQSDRELRSIHCLRFLTDAFRTRPELLTFSPDLADYINSKVVPGGDLLAAKLALEAIGILSEDHAEPALMSAFKIGNPWLCETALRSCRHLKQVGQGLQSRMEQYMSSIPMWEYIGRRREIMFSFSLSDAFRGLARYCRLRSIDYGGYVCGLAISILIAPMVLVAILEFYLLNLLFKYTGRLRRSISMKLMGVTERMIVAGILVTSLGALKPLIGMAHSLKIDTFIMPVVQQSRHDLADFRFEILVAPLRVLAHGHMQTIVVGVYLMTAVSVFPWLDFSYAIVRLRGQRSIVKRLLKFFAEILLVFCGAGVLIYLLVRYRVLDGFVPICLSWLAALGVIVWIVWRMNDEFKDFRILRKAMLSTALTKETIEETFLSFKAPRCRFKYVKWLRESQVRPYGSWLNHRPNRDDDEASSLLAQLDEQWLGLDA